MHPPLPTLVLSLLSLSVQVLAQPSTDVRLEVGTVVTETYRSAALSKTLTSLDPNRVIKIYLPPGYHESNKTYPVVYYFHSLNWSAEKMFHDGQVARLIDRAIATGVTPEFIMVVADYSSPSLGSWYENSPVTGNWIDFTVKELIPFIEGRYRIRRQRESRAVAGDFVGGRGALYFAMNYPDLFSIVYAMHPVATGTGYRPMISNADWKQILNAKSTAELTGFSIPYVAIHQAFLLFSWIIRLPTMRKPCDHCTSLSTGRAMILTTTTCMPTVSLH
jgi:enterochelin esterase-like enzyme